MIDRNRRIKLAPERWQDSRIVSDIVITCEERCFDAVCEGMAHLRLQQYALTPRRFASSGRRVQSASSCHKYRDQGQSRRGVNCWKSHAGFSSRGTRRASFGVFATQRLQIESSNDIDEDIDKILRLHQEKHPHSILHSVCYF